MSAGCDAAGAVPIGLADLPVVAALHTTCFPDDPWPPQAIADVLAMPGAVGWLTYGKDGMPTAFLLALCLVPEAEILSIGVAPGVRGRGLGRHLIESFADFAQRRGAREVLLEVAEDNVAGRRLYARAGFVLVGRRPNYYKRPDGAVAALSLRLMLDSRPENKPPGTV